MCSDCAICWYADGGCLAGMRDDLFVIAEKEQIIKRLDNSQYEKHSRLMKETLIRGNTCKPFGSNFKTHRVLFCKLSED